MPQSPRPWFRKQTGWWMAQVAGKQEKLTGEIADIVAYDFDATATLAMFDPARAKDPKVYRAYRQMKSGAYSASFGGGMKVSIAGMTAGRPSASSSGSCSRRSLAAPKMPRSTASRRSRCTRGARGPG